MDIVLTLMSFLYEMFSYKNSCGHACLGLCTQHWEETTEPVQHYKDREDRDSHGHYEFWAGEDNIGLPGALWY